MSLQEASEDQPGFERVPRSDTPAVAHVPTGAGLLFEAAIADPDSAVMVRGVSYRRATSIQNLSHQLRSRWYRRVQVTTRKQADGTYTVWVTAVQS